MPSLPFLAEGRHGIALAFREPGQNPGLFARLKLAVSGRYEAVLISDRAVGTDLSNQFVLVVNSANEVSYRAVTLGSRLQGLRVVKDGLQDGEHIVVNGLQRVRPGSQVQPQTVPMASADALARLAREQNALLPAEPALSLHESLPAIIPRG